MSETHHNDVDWAPAAEQSSEEDQAQEGNIRADDEDSSEAAEHVALHVEDENVDALDNLDAALDALAESSDPEADALVDDALAVADRTEIEAAAEAVEDEEDEDAEEAAGENTGVVDASDPSVLDEVSGNATDADATVDPYEAFRNDLRFLPGKWYVIHSYAGFERRVKSNIENRKQSMAMEDFIYQVEVPMEDVVEIKNGQRKMVTRVRIPGYVLVRMDLNEDSWSVVRHTPGVTGFVGNSHNPTPLRLDEAFGMLKGLVEIPDVTPAKSGGGQGTKAQTRVIPAEVDFEIGETITIKEGSFAGLPGSISEIKPESGKLTVLVSLFERETPVELSFDQVTKL
ncbi:transcription termination/antitermination protein NusG [Cryobacterium tepidiphilum]|uniref:Transcription termination/antitermination protein NusG n=1 Tax=Cryobacterium tepidiphilum TaxID=2486026 RepID=A0A3M8KTK0_9MICO|nr:transcription termination/antitermination protein NusG [Cryobacterium tepidiphilum]RNE56637.1 transcription termination/antitermination protein NusG [Cryobacterium tepidiphilum]